MRRTFVAVDISDESRQAAADYIDKLRSRFPGVRVGWERPEKLHLTLKFVGDADDSQVSALAGAASLIAENHSRFEITLEGTGAFPPRGPSRILWLGVTAPSVLADIAEALESGCRALGFKAENRSFSPHLTIGRVREPQHADQLRNEHLSSEFGPIKTAVQEIAIYESQLRSGGSVYERIGSAPLKNL